MSTAAPYRFALGSRTLMARFQLLATSASDGLRKPPSLGGDSTSLYGVVGQVTRRAHREKNEERNAKKESNEGKEEGEQRSMSKTLCAPPERILGQVSYLWGLLLRDPPL